MPVRVGAIWGQVIEKVGSKKDANFWKVCANGVLIRWLDSELLGRGIGLHLIVRVNIDLTFTAGLEEPSWRDPFVSSVCGVVLKP